MYIMSQNALHTTTKGPVKAPIASSQNTNNHHTHAIKKISSGSGGGKHTNSNHLDENHNNRVMNTPIIQDTKNLAVRKLFSNLIC